MAHAANSIFDSYLICCGLWPIRPTVFLTATLSAVECGPYGQQYFRQLPYLLWTVAHTANSILDSYLICCGLWPIRPKVFLPATLSAVDCGPYCQQYFRQLPYLLWTVAHRLTVNICGIFQYMYVFEMPES